MKKLGLIVLVAGIILMAGCAGDDPVGPGGTLAPVTGVEIGTASAGQDVVVNWTAVSDVDGYKVWFKATSTGTWAEVGDVTGVTFTHVAPSAGYYVVTAYKGSDTSSANSNEVNTMPNQINETYTIWDNHAPVDEHSGFAFGESAGLTVPVLSSTNFDIYCYDGGWTESPCGFYSGDVAPFGNGRPTDMSDAGTGYGYPTGNWWVTGYILAGDVIFCELEDGHFVKVYVQSVPQHSTQPAAHGIVFYYDYQPIEGLYLFTTESS
ncbi:MAG: fibronectin type III domain-containing protein [Candidatus Fermentibacteria bacterium]